MKTDGTPAGCTPDTAAWPSSVTQKKFQQDSRGQGHRQTTGRSEWTNRANVVRLVTACMGPEYFVIRTGRVNNGTKAVVRAGNIGAAKGKPINEQ